MKIIKIKNKTILKKVKFSMKSLTFSYLICTLNYILLKSCRAQLGQALMMADRCGSVVVRVSYREIRIQWLGGCFNLVARVHSLFRSRSRKGAWGRGWSYS